MALLWSDVRQTLHYLTKDKEYRTLEEPFLLQNGSSKVL